MSKQCPLRSMMAQSQKMSYLFVDTLKEAQLADNYYLVMEGDDGGQIYLTCPAKMIKCDEATLRTILEIVDRHEWPENSADMHGFYFEYHEPNSTVPGGMGGGQALPGQLWLHDNLKSVTAPIGALIFGVGNPKEALRDFKQTLNI